MTAVLMTLLISTLTALTASGNRVAQAQTRTGREHIRFDANWRFRITPPSALGNPTAITEWRWQSADSGKSPDSPPAALNENSGQRTAIGEDVFRGRRGVAWFWTTLPSLGGPGRTLHFDGVDDNADVYLNGKRLTHHEGWNDPFEVSLDAAWNPSGPNRLVLRVENTEGAGGLTGAVTLGGQAGNGDDPSRSAYDDRNWRTVHLPHDYVVEQVFSPKADAAHGSLPTPPAWYRKTFTIPREDRGRALWLDFDGVYRDAKVYLNGQLLGEHPCGYTGFRYDITRAVRYGGENVLAVSVDPRKYEGWWYEGGGIYRHVWLNKADPLHIAPWGTFVTSEVRDPLGDASAQLAIKTTVVNEGDQPRSALLVAEVLAPDGKRVVGSRRVAVSIAPGARQEITQQILVPHAHLWSLEAPNLYRLRTRLVETGSESARDQIETPFGIRTLRFDADKGFFLNEKHVEIQGVCNHQDYAGVGVAIPDNLQEWRVQKMKEIGCNAWRMSHNPPNPELLDACDRLGMLVMDETRHLGDTERGKAPRGTTATELTELTSMILRDRNHPSIMMWSMANEEPLQGTDEGARIFTAMRERVRQYDTTRPVTAGMNDGAAHGIALVGDTRGFNYHPTSYTGYHKNQGTMPLYGSEIGSTTTTRGIYADDKTKGYVRAYDTYAPSWAQTAEDTWTPIATQPFMMGGFVWTGFDYKGEPTPYGWPCVNSHFGIVDLCGFVKDTGYYYRTYWKEEEPQVHLLPHWNWPGKEKQPISVWAFSNGDQIELFVNGKSQGRQDLVRYRHVEWSVPYAPGTLEARAYRNGKVIATDRVETTTASAALTLATTRRTLTADGEEVTVVEVGVVDAKGRIVPTADDRVTFSVEGAGQIVGVGNGDPSDHDPDTGTFRRAFGGRCVVIVGASTRPGAIRLTASAPGLRSATLVLQANKSSEDDN